MQASFFKMLEVLLLSYCFLEDNSFTKSPTAHLSSAYELSSNKTSPKWSVTVLHQQLRKLSEFSN